MEEIIDVEFKEVEELEEKSNEDLCKEVNLYWNQMELLGKLGFEFAARAGQRLNIIKGRLHHGEWEEWCKNNLVFSKRKAENMMKLATKMEDENSLFFKNANFADIGISKIWALLGAPEEVAEEVLQNPESEDMSVREFKDEIRRLKEKNANLENMVQESTEQNSSIERELRAQIEKLKEELEISTYDEVAGLDFEMKEQELDDLKEKLEKEKRKTKELKDSIEIEKNEAAAKAEKKAKEQIEEAEKNAKEQAAKEFDEATRQLKESNEQAAREIDRLQKLAGGNTELAIFKVKSDQLQQDFNACLTSTVEVEETNPEQAVKMRTALRTVMEKLIDRIGD